MNDKQMMAKWLKTNKATVVAPVVARVDREVRPVNTYSSRVAYANSAVPVGSAMSSNNGLNHLGY